MRAIATCVLAGLCFVGGCGKSNGLLPPVPAPLIAACTGQVQTATESGSVANISENVDATCVSVVETLDWQNAATGAACKTPADCTPVCVPCPNGTHHSLAAWCNHQVCAAPETVACMIAGTPGLAGCSK